MIYKYVRKKFIELPLTEKLKQDCIAQIEALAAKDCLRESPLSKSDAIIKICQKLTRVGENIGGGGQEGLQLLQFVKALAMEIHEDSRVQLFTIKIRTYLLTLRWAKAKGTPLGKLVSRVHLFLEQIKTAPLYDLLFADYYSHIERLYLEVIKEKVKNNELTESLKLIGVCFESFKAQITAICNIFTIEERKLHRLIETKLELLGQLFKLEHAVKYLSGSLQPEEVTAQILPRYERITFKIPTIHFPNQKLTEQCESLWVNKGTKTIKRSSFDRKTKNSSVVMRMSEMKIEGKSRQRESLKETVEYLNDFFRKRTKSAIQLNFDRTILPKDGTVKKSYFQKENIDNLRMSQQSVDSSKVKKRTLHQVGKMGKEKSAHIIEPKKFKLVLEMERENREKILKMDPFKDMKADELNFLTSSKMQNKLIFLSK